MRLPLRHPRKLFVVTDNFVFVKTKFLRLRLDCFACSQNISPSRICTEKYEAVHTFRSCASSWIRTNDLILKRDLLYQLSYRRSLTKVTEKIRKINLFLSYKLQKKTALRSSSFNLFAICARGETRTLTPLRAKDFKSFVATITPPGHFNFAEFCVAKFLRPRSELNRRIEILQISALPLGYWA